MLLYTAKLVSCCPQKGIKMVSSVNTHITFTVASWNHCPLVVLFGLCTYAAQLFVTGFLLTRVHFIFCLKYKCYTGAQFVGNWYQHIYLQLHFFVFQIFLRKLLSSPFYLRLGHLQRIREMYKLVILSHLHHDICFCTKLAKTV